MSDLSHECRLTLPCDGIPKTVEGGVPPFPLPITSCNALNASPYALDLAQFEARFVHPGPRRIQFDALIEVVKGVADCGAVPLAILVGGSYLQLRVAAPRDLDGVLFYRSKEEVRECAPCLVDVWQRGQQDGIDVRLVPYDANPLVALKACSFFSLLYARTRESDRLQRGCVLVSLVTDASQ